MTTCVECGFYEPVCPSRDSPRRRASGSCCGARWPASRQALRCWALLEQYRYEGIETYAADGTCVPACPLGIDTGKLVKGFPGRQQSERAERRPGASCAPLGPRSRGSRGPACAPAGCSARPMRGGSRGRRGRS